MQPLQWRTLEYKEKKRSRDWFWAVGIIVISASITSFIFGNFLFGILLIVGTGALMLYATRSPLEIDIAIEEKGVRAGKEFYPYSSLGGFAIIEDGVYPRILLKSKKFFLPYIVIGLENMNPEEIRKNLSPRLPEEELRESLFEILMDRLGF